MRHTLVLGIALSVFLSLVLAAPARAGESADDVTAQTANTAFVGEQWEEAARQYGVLTAKPGAKPGMWYRLGFARHRLGRHEQAEGAYLEAAKAPRLALTAHYNVACGRALRGKQDAAFEALAACLAAGFHDALLLEGDADLASLREDPRWNDVLARAKAKRATIPRRQFDFWVGTWKVHDAAGKFLGSNVISLRQNRNVVHEAWTSPGGNTGESINFYDPGKGHWRQVWVNDRGSVVEYDGEFEDGAMRFTGRNTNNGGQTSLARATFAELDDGRVRQHLESSTDGGRTWTTTFDGYYSREP